MKRLLGATIAAVLASAVAIAAQAGTLQTIPGNRVFVHANSPDANRVVVLRRSAEGKLSKVSTHLTGGKGAGTGELLPTDPLASQDSLVLSDDGRWLFVTNAGSNQLSVFRVIAGSLLLTSVVSSGGMYPTSVTANGDSVYVLNAGGETNVVGFKLSPLGQLSRIPGATRKLLTVTDKVGKQANPLNSPAQLRFSPDGNFLAISDKNVFNPPGLMQLFKVGPDGTLADQPVATSTTGPGPFGFTFDGKGHLLVVDVLTSSTASYNVNDSGVLDLISSVPNGRVEACWIDLSRNFAFVSNTSSDDLSLYRVDGNGQLTLLQASVGKGSAPVDISVSGDQRWLHVLSGERGVVRAFRIDPVSGNPTLTDEIKLFEPLAGAQGIVAE